tara:strand:- start:46860 stop:47294 length:435 start_codon:yes stop_codon:yes gene_type:complete
MNNHYGYQHGFIRVFMLSAFLSVFCVFAGCGPSEPEKVIGTVAISVTHAGKPVTEGSVSMIEIGSSKSAYGTLNETGNITIENVEVGNYTVSILPPPLPPADPSQPSVPMKKYLNIPDKFRSETTSPLTAEVKEGANEFQFELK